MSSTKQGGNNLLNTEVLEDLNSAISDAKTQQFDAGDLAEIEIYKLFRKWRSSQKRPRVADAFRSGYLEGKAR